MDLFFNEAWVPTSTFASSLDAIKDAIDIGPFTGVCVVGEDRTSMRMIWRALDLGFSPSPYLNAGERYPTVGLYTGPASNVAYLVISNGVHSISFPDAKSAATLCLAVSDVVVLVGSSHRGETFSPLNIRGIYETFLNLLHITATLETELRPAKFVSVDFYTSAVSDRKGSKEAVPALLSKVNASMRGDRHLNITWSNHILENGYERSYPTVTSPAHVLEALRMDVATGTPRFTRATWGMFVQASWGRIKEGRMPTIVTALALFRDRIQNRKAEIFSGIQMASPQDLYDCSALNDAQDALEKEIDVVPSWVALDPAHSRVTLLRDLISAMFDAALLRLSEISEAKLQEVLRDANALTEDIITRWSEMRVELAELKSTHLVAFVQAAADIKLMKYSKGKRLLGLGLTPDVMEQAYLGTVEEQIGQPTPSQLKEAQSRFLGSLDRIIETELGAASQSLLQHINQKLDGLIDSFEKLCGLPEVSNLAHNVWALCVSETQSLWKIYGRACKGLLVTPDQLQKCIVMISNLLLNEDATETEIRHPWDTLLMQVMSRLISDLDLSVEGVVRLFNLRDKAMRAEGLSPSQAMKETEALKHTLSRLDLIGTRPRSLNVDVLPSVKLEPEEEELLTLPLLSVHDAWEQFALELQSDITPDTHIEDGSAGFQEPPADCTCHLTSE